MHKWNWAVFWAVRWFSGQIRLFFFLLALFFKFLLKLAALLEQLKFLCYYFGWLLMIWEIRHACKLCWRHCLFMVKCVKGQTEYITSCISSNLWINDTDLSYSVKLWYLNPYNPFRNTVDVEMFSIQEGPEQLMVGDQEHSQEVLQILTLFLHCSHGGYFLQLLE